QLEPVPESDIHENVDGRRQIQLAALRELVATGDVKKTGEGKRRNPYLYALAATPPDVSGTRGSPRGQEPETRNDLTMRKDGADSDTGAREPETPPEPQTAATEDLRF